MLESAVNWARKFSLFNYPFVTACCGMEFMSTAAPKYDIARFGAEFPRFSPRQSDLLIIVGTITERQGPALRRIYEQMCEPKWVIAFGVCASTGGFYQNYSTMPGADQVVPVDVYIPGCPPRPEQVLDGLMLLHGSDPARRRAQPDHDQGREVRHPAGRDPAAGAPRARPRRGPIVECFFDRSVGCHARQAQVGPRDMAQIVLDTLVAHFTNGEIHRDRLAARQRVGAHSPRRLGDGRPVPAR